MPTSFDLVEVVNGEGDLVDVRVTTGAANPLVLACIALGGVVLRNVIDLFEFVVKVFSGESTA